MSASEFAYDFKMRLGPYRFYWISKYHKHLVKSEGWKRLWIEKHIGNGRWAIVYGMRKSK